MNTISEQEEYKLPSGEIISIQRDSLGIWEVACWDKVGECRWSREFKNAAEAHAEFERWRPSL